MLGNVLYSGILERFPGVKIVSVESGIGWVPFMLEALDYEWEETGSAAEYPLPHPPSYYFKRQVYACFWFEHAAPTRLIDEIGEDNVLFETDFPHPTCQYPNVQAYLVDVTAGWTETRRPQDSAGQCRASLPRGPWGLEEVDLTGGVSARIPSRLRSREQRRDAGDGA